MRVIASRSSECGGAQCIEKSLPILLDLMRDQARDNADRVAKGMIKHLAFRVSVLDLRAKYIHSSRITGEQLQIS